MAMALTTFTLLSVLNTTPITRYTSTIHWEMKYIVLKVIKTSGMVTTLTANACRKGYISTFLVQTEVSSKKSAAGCTSIIK